MKRYHPSHRHRGSGFCIFASCSRKSCQRHGEQTNELLGLLIKLGHMLKQDVVNTHARGGHCIGDCTPTRDRGQSEVKRSRRNFEAGQAVKLGIGGSLRTVKVSPGDRWAWLMLDSQGSRPDFRCGQRVKHENLLGQDLDRGRGWEYSRLCSVPPPCHAHATKR